MSLRDPCIRWLWYVADYRIIKSCVLLLREEKMENPGSTHECVAAILEMAGKPMVQICLTAIRTCYLLNKGDRHRKKNTESKVQSLSQIIEIAPKNQPAVADTEQNVQTSQEIILEADLDFANRELKELNQTFQYKSNKYTVSVLERDSSVLNLYDSDGDNSELLEDSGPRPNQFDPRRIRRGDK